MAVYQGARLRTDGLSSARTARQARTTTPAPEAGSARVRPMGVLMAITVAATMVGLVYLTQTLGTNATTTEIGRLETQAWEIARDTKTLQVNILRAKEPDSIAPKAQKQELKKLGGITVLTAP